jgi:hypothetical protein
MQKMMRQMKGGRLPTLPPELSAPAGAPRGKVALAPPRSRKKKRRR